jgi:hypothetical protein
LHFRLNGDFHYLVLVGGGLGVEFNRQTTLDGVVKVSQKFFLRVALSGATRNSGDFGPEAAFLCGMNDGSEFHRD